MPEDILQKIIATKRDELATTMRARSLSDVRADAESASPPRDFTASLMQPMEVSLIAEVKKASPSAGVIRADFDPVSIAQTYADNGAACISVLTDEPFFQGRLEYLTQVRAAVDVPVLRKDFLLERYQIFEARAAGADCVLLIAECLDDAQLRDLFDTAIGLGMSALVELYEPANLDRVLALDPPFFGVNNRNLRTFETRLEHSLEIRKQAPADVGMVSESGIRTRDDVRRLEDAGINAMLVGETLMRAADIGSAVQALIIPG